MVMTPPLITVLVSAADHCIGECILWGRGAVLGAEEQELGAHGMEEGSLQSLWEAGM